MLRALCVLCLCVQMRAELFRDTPDALVEWRNQGLKTYIYSSGSREAQRLFFGYSTVRCWWRVGR